MNVYLCNVLLAFLTERLQYTIYLLLTDFPDPVHHCKQALGSTVHKGSSRPKRNLNTCGHNGYYTGRDTRKFWQ